MGDSGGVEALKIAITYIYADMPVHGGATLKDLAQAGVTILVNNFGDNSFNHDSNVLAWDPSTGLIVRDAAGDVIGMNSAALNFLHEAVHASDPNFLENVNSPNAMWRNDAERFAIHAVNEAAIEGGEAVRVDHGGNEVAAANPTVHTNDMGDLDGDGYSDGYWSQIGEDGLIELGPVYSGYDLTVTPAPRFGGPAAPNTGGSGTSPGGTTGPATGGSGGGPGGAGASPATGAAGGSGGAPSNGGGAPSTGGDDAGGGGGAGDFGGWYSDDYPVPGDGSGGGGSTWPAVPRTNAEPQPQEEQVDDILTYLLGSNQPVAEPAQEVSAALEGHVDVHLVGAAIFDAPYVMII